jgi:hypothetical protein
MNKAQLDQDDSRWQWLYRLGGAAALLIVAFIPLQVIIFMTWPPPSTALGYFTLFQSNPLVALLDLDLLLLIDQMAGIVILLAFYVALRRANEAAMIVALALGLVATASYFASNTAFNMLTLSNQYAAATTEAQRAMFLAAGESMLAIYTGTAFHISYILGSIVLIIIPVVMLRSGLFSKSTTYTGLLANIIALGLYVPVVGIYISIFSVLFLAIFYLLAARRLFQMGRRAGQLVLQLA